MKHLKKDRMVCLVFALFFTAGFLLCVFGSKEEYSDSERRRLAPMPKLSADAVWSGRFMSDFESYAVDALPFREQFRTIQALAADKIFGRKDNNGLYASDGYLSALEYPENEASLDRAAERFRYLKEKYLTEGNRIFLSVIPDKNCFLAQESGHPSLDYGEFEQRMAQKTEFAEYIEISDLLQREDYYKTDPHWRQEQITDVAVRLAERMGTDLTAEYEVHTLEEAFYGAYYGQAALPLKPDTLTYLTGEGMEGCRVYDWQNGKEIPVYDMERAAGRDPYEMFLSGSLSLLTIENPKAQQDKKLVIFRDSFGSAIAPLLISGYAKITLVDIRYIHPDNLGRLVDFEDSDVLFLYSTLVLNHSETLK